MFAFLPVPASDNYSKWVVNCLRNRHRLLSNSISLVCLFLMESDHSNYGAIIVLRREQLEEGVEDNYREEEQEIKGVWVCRKEVVGSSEESAPVP